MENQKMTSEYQNLRDYLSQPGQTVVGLMRKFNNERIREQRTRVAASTFYSWCRGDSQPTKYWDMSTLSRLTGIAKEKLFAE